MARPAATIEQQIAKRQLAPVYVIHGEDVKRAEALVDAIEGTIEPADRPFAVERLYAGEEPGGLPVNVASAARSLPMLGDRRIVIVLRAERWLKPTRAKAAAEDVETDEAASDEAPDDLQPLEDYLDNPSPTSALVFVAADIDRSRRLTKRLMKEAEVVECGWPSSDRGRAAAREARAAAAALVQQQVTKAGRTIDPAAVQLLAEQAGTDVSRLRGDLERLLLFTEGQRKIALEDVRETVSSDVSVDDEWAVVEAIAAGDAARALRETARRLDRGDSPHALVGQLRWWVSNRLAASDAGRVRPAIDALLRTDLALKSSGGDERVLVERLIVELTGRPIPAWGSRR